MIECHGARTFFLAVSHGANTIFHRFFAMWHYFFFSYDNLHLHRPHAPISIAWSLRQTNEYFSRNIVYTVRKVTFWPTMIQYLSAWCMSHATSSKMCFRSAFHEICCTCFGHLVSHTCKSKISEKTLAYSFWHHYRTEFVETKFFSHYSEPSCGLQSVVNARLPR